MPVSPKEESAMSFDTVGRGTRSRSAAADSIMSISANSRSVRLTLAAAVFIVALIQSSSGRSDPRPQVLANITCPADPEGFSSDGRQLLFGSYWGVVQIWDTASGRRIRTFLPKEIGRRQYSQAIGYSPKLDTLVASDRYGTMSVWRASTGQLVRTLKSQRTNAPDAVTFAPEGNMLLAINRGTITTWDTTTWKAIRTFEADADVSRSSRTHVAALSPDAKRGLIGLSAIDWRGDTVAEDTFSPHIKLVDLTTGLAVWSLHAAIRAVAFSPDGAHLVISGKLDDHSSDSSGDITNDIKLRVLDAKTGKQIRVFASEGDTADVRSVAFSRDAARVFSVSVAGSIKIWDLRTGRLVQEGTIPISGHPQAITTLLSPQGEWLLTSDPNEGKRLWDPQTAQLVGTLCVEVGQTRSISLAAATDAAGLRLLLAGNFIGDSGAIHRWNLATGRLLGSVTVKGTSSDSSVSPLLAFTTDGARAVTGSERVELADKSSSPPSDNTLTIWDLATGAAIRTLPGHSGRVTAVAFSPHGKSIVSAGDDIAILWNSESGQVRWTADAPEPGDYRGIAFSPRGDRLLVGRRWPAALAPLLPAGADREGAVLLDVKTGNSIREFLTDGDCCSWVSSVAFSPDGRRLIAGLRGKGAAIWNVETGTRLRTLDDESGVGQVVVAFSPDGKRVLTGVDCACTEDGGTTRLWDAMKGGLLRTFRPDAAISFTTSVAFSSDGARVFSGDQDGSIAIWNAETGARLATMIATANGDWVTITAEGFFDASTKESQLIHVVSGMQIVSLDKVFDKLHRPDLVREKLAGDPQGKVREAAAKLDLSKALASGKRH
jgi:WD40 repeat protein